MRSVPIQSVQLFSVLADGRETIVDSHSVTLTETSLRDVDETPGEGGVDDVGGSLTAGREVVGSGVACVASVNGSLTPPSVRVMINNNDVTRSYIHCVSKNIPDIFDCNLKKDYQI